jgi:predicted ATPase
MLLKFRVANYRSIRDEQELSFVATELNEGTARDVPVRPSGTVRALPVIGVYGENASGKSNLLRALFDLARLATGRLVPRALASGGDMGWDPFVLDAESAGRPTRFEAEFLVDSVRYAYGLSYTDAAVDAEWLHAYPQGRRQVWFERIPESPDRFRFPDNHLGITQALLAELARPDRPFLSLGEAVRHEQLSPVVRWFQGLRRTSRARRLSSTSDHLIGLLGADSSASVIEMLQRADFGIVGADIVEVAEPGFGVEPRRPRVRREVRLRHKGVSGSLATLPLHEESDGTLAWLHILQPLLRVLETSGVLIVDELDASLHPELAAETIRMFYDRRLNTGGAQLLFSSHDVTMLGTTYGSPLLSRDQVWFTDKNNEGATELYPLADFKPRKGENIERGYLAGRYGAVPGLSPGELARTLWPPDSAEDGA